MASTTSRLGMTLPAASDAADITVLNENFNLIEAWLVNCAIGHTGGKTVDTLDNAVTFGLFVSNVGTPDGVYWDCLALPHNANNILQIAYRATYSPSRICIRRKTDGTWGEWEWLNPPMLPDVEYRTVERAGNKPVYKKRIVYQTTDIGSAGNVTTVSIPHGITGFGANVSVNASMGNNALLPHMDGSGNMTCVAGVSGTAITLRTMAAWSGNRTWTFDIAYTKA